MEVNRFRASDLLGFGSHEIASLFRVAAFNGYLLSKKIPGARPYFD